MRARLAALVLLPALVGVAGCGEDPAEQAASASPEAPAATAATAGDDQVGDLAGAMVADTTTTTTTTTTTVVPTTATTTVVPDVDVEADPVQAYCDRIAVFLITTNTLGPDATPEEIAAITQSGQDLADDANELVTSLDPDDAVRLVDCLERISDAVPR